MQADNLRFEQPASTMLSNSLFPAKIVLGRRAAWWAPPACAVHKFCYI